MSRSRVLLMPNLPHVVHRHLNYDRRLHVAGGRPIVRIVRRPYCSRVKAEGGVVLWTAYFLGAVLCKLFFCESSASARHEFGTTCMRRDEHRAWDRIDQTRYLSVPGFEVDEICLRRSYVKH
jgi:hypothetical protein